jgi:molybdopterin-binding protein
MIQVDMPNDSRRILTVRAAAGRLGVSYSTVKQWIYKGSVRTVRTSGGHHRIAEAEVDRLLSASGRHPPAARAPKPATGVLVALSGRNQLRGIVDEVRVEGLLAQVRLRIGDQRLTAIITRDAVDVLKLKRGQPALAVVKSTEVMIGLESDGESGDSGGRASRASGGRASRVLGGRASRGH